MHKLGCTEEMLQTISTENVEEKQKPRGKLVHMKIQRTENDIREIGEIFNVVELIQETNCSQSQQLKKLTAKTAHSEKRLNDRIK